MDGMKVFMFKFDESEICSLKIIVNIFKSYNLTIFICITFDWMIEHHHLVVISSLLSWIYIFHKLKDEIGIRLVKHRIHDVYRRNFVLPTKVIHIAFHIAGCVIFCLDIILRKLCFSI